MTSGKLRRLQTRSFGAEPSVPDVPALAEWVNERRGKRGDLTSYLLLQSLNPQLEAGINLPCAGGRFYDSRLVGCLLGVEKGKTIGEIGVSPDPVIADSVETAEMVRGVYVSMPAPHMLGIADGYYHDEDEWADALNGAYRVLLRAMRDAGCGGHVLLCDHIEETETAALSGKKVFFFHPSPGVEDFRALLEYQRRVAVRNQDIPTVLGLADEYELNQIVIMDPEEPAIISLLERFDPGSISAGGYCTQRCSGYWKDLMEFAVYRS